MPSLKMLPHVVTLFNSVGEIDGAEMFVKTILRDVQIDENFGTAQSLRGHNSDDSAALYVFDDFVKAQSYDGLQKSYLLPCDFKSEEYKEMYWTLKEGDYFVSGETDATDPRDIGAFKITKISRYNMGTRRMRHFEVYGR